MTEQIILVALVICAVSGVPGLFLSRWNNSGQRLTTTLAVFGAGMGLVGLGMFWTAAAYGPENALRLVWPGPSLEGVGISIGVDGLSALFLLPIFLISLLGSVYGLGYWKQSEHAQNGRKLRLFYGLLTAGMGLVVLARDSIGFLVGWEIMALSAYFLVTTEDHIPDVREAGWIYLVATHVATLCLFALFGIMRAVGGTFDFVPIAQQPSSDQLSSNWLWSIFILALAGFGLKAGIMPLHVWLPSAHALAPSHVSAIMSGVIIKMGVYGLARIFSLIPHPPVEWGCIVLALGAISGVLGVAYAIGQHDLKRLLAYHSIENIGIIVMGLGLVLLGRSLDRPAWIILGLGGALLHVVNHAVFKALLFLSAGSVIHAVHTRDIDRLGGLQKAMPWTAFCFLVGAVAICGLPPLNGFISEFLIYSGLFTSQLSTAGSWTPAARYLVTSILFAIPALALIGTLAVACFVKVYGAVFLGTARYPQLIAQESPSSMLAPMGCLVACCFFIGLVPVVIGPVLDAATAAWSATPKERLIRITSAAPLGWITLIEVALLFVLVVFFFALMALLKKRSAVETAQLKATTWACGYAAVTARMQYTSSSFAQMLVWLFAWALHPHVKNPNIGHGNRVATGVFFPRQTNFHSVTADVVLDETVLPTFRLGARLVSWFRPLQQGNIQTYLGYILFVLIILLLWR
jgi:hydrogenase-4 component B